MSDIIYSDSTTGLKGKFFDLRTENTKLRQSNAELLEALDLAEEVMDRNCPKFLNTISMELATASQKRIIWNRERRDKIKQIITKHKEKNQ